MFDRDFTAVRIRSRLVAGAITVVLTGVIAGAGTAVEAAGNGAAVLYRVFLKDGGVLVSYGEFARVADRVVLSIPIGGTDTAPVLHLISIPEKDIEWERTNA